MIDLKPMTGTRAVALVFSTSVIIFTGWVFIAAIVKAVTLLF